MKNTIKKIDIDMEDNVTFWFYGSPEPWDILEFKIGSATRECLELIRDLVLKK